jgi:predicted DNA-binding transcriptional regulator AlpA
VSSRVDPDDLIDSDQVAQLLGLASAAAVRVYVGRYLNFPEPLVRRGRCVLWHKASIEAWAAGPRERK